jgi:uncharacterized protein (DUF927 family)
MRLRPGGYLEQPMIITHESNSLYEAALSWARRGYNVVPQKAVDKKHPGVEWRALLDRRVTPEELKSWRPMFDKGVGFITGGISGVIIIESDGPEGEAVLAEFERRQGPLPDTLTIRSGSGRGLHRHFKHPGYLVKTVANISIKLDVKGDKGYCVLPPSLHKSGGRYEVVSDFDPAPLPAGLLEFIAERAAEKSGALPSRAPATRLSAPAQAGSSEGNIAPSSLPPPPVETMRAMLRHLAMRACFEGRKEWIEAGMALKLTYGDQVGSDLWAETHIDDRARADAPSQWSSFAADAQSGHVTIGTIINAAKNTGFPLPLQKADASKKAEEAASAHRSYYPFTMDPEEGLTKEVAGRGKVSIPETIWISASFEVLGRCRDPQGLGWGKQLQFRDADHRLHARHVSDAALHGDPAPLCAELASEGLAIHRQRQKEFAEYLSGVALDERITNVGRTGWHDLDGERVFVLPTGPIALASGERVVLDAKANGPYEVRGTLENWKRGVGALTAGHALPVFMVSAALAGPLTHLVGAEGGGVHVFGAEGGGVHVFGTSSIGKSAMLAAGASVWGRGGTPGYVRSWRATGNGLEGAAASATDTCLVLDELGVGNPREVADSIYALANGSAKQRARRDGSLQDPKAWRVFLLSSGELPIGTKIAEDYGRKTRAGQTIRLLDLPADRGHGFGAFDNGGENADAGKLADAIKDAARSAYGTAGPEFVRRLIDGDLDRAVVETRRGIVTFIEKFVATGASEQIARAAKKFALIGVAGEMAAALGVTLWAKGEAQSAAVGAFRRWLETRGGTSSHEENQAIEQVRLMMVQHGEARFECADGSLSPVRDRLGWYKGLGSRREWWVPPETWKAEFCARLDPTSVARALEAQGMLRRQDKKNLTCVVALDGGRKTRCYVLTAAVL